MNVSRRNFAAAGGALFGAGALPAFADDGHKNDGKAADTLYGHGMVWNRELSGDAGQVKLSFDLRVNLETGTGFGTAGDPTFPDWNIQFEIKTAKRKKLPRGESRYTLVGAVSRAGTGGPVKVGDRSRFWPRRVEIRRRSPSPSAHTSSGVPGSL